MPKTVRYKLNACKGICTAAIMLLPAIVFSQSARKIERAGDGAFARTDYYSASKLYAAILYDSPLTALGNSRLYPFQTRNNSKPEKISDSRRNEVVFKLAESYRLYNRPKDAALQYEKYIASKDMHNPTAQLWYGYTLIANNEPEKATVAFNNYLKTNRTKDANATKAREGIASANFILANKTLKPAAEVTKLNATNPQDGSDFALEKINDSLFWFTTSRHEIDKKGEKVYPIRLYTGNLNNRTASRPAPIPGELNMATPSLSSDGLTMYFTGWKSNAKSGATTPYHIYYMIRNAVDSPWHLPVEMGSSVNQANYQSKQPYITRDSKYLFFASDQPGGAGKFDIWMVPMEGRNVLGKAVHVDSINTAGDEVTPFYDLDSAKLYFSSDGRIGMGGLDIYSAAGHPSGNRWGHITNLGAPLNSVRDDQYYRKEKNSQTAYLSSDRASSCCLEIFKAVTVKYIDTAGKQPVMAKTELPKSVSTPAVTDDAEEKKNRRILDSINSNMLERAYVHYDYASSKIRRTDRPQLDIIVKQLKENALLNIVVASFTDCNGTPAGNERVAKARSQSVKAYLVAHGINASRINTDFFSRKHFVLPCLADKSFNKEAQLANRRSDLIITKEQHPKWRPMGNELDLDPAQMNPLFRTVNANADARSSVASNRPVPVSGAGTAPASGPVKTTDAATEKSATPAAAEKSGSKAASVKIPDTHTRPDKANTGALIKEAKPKTGSSNYAGTAAKKETKNAAADDRAALVRRAPAATASAPAVKNRPAPPLKLDIDNILDFTPKVKTGVIEEMTKRIPRQPLYVYSTSDSVRVDLYDNGVFDGDSVSVIFNKQLVAYQRVLQTSKPVTFYIKLSTDVAKNEMIFFAENLGLTPPNSALMVITDSENRRTEVNVASDLEHNTVIYFIKLKK
ncbi:OmpA family protein [Sediminibacterium soli]|uniref:OmpA family protein n=1 Tax=Sediminibacterium soli TaxID=2698829 RepID=UPI00137AF487|nr:OmpA family protein [Sediminibacterium soli]NCI47608.1 OmpA family protein [Sediminibacterium soli]